MRIVGLCGGSGTGKTTVADHLEKHGAGRIDADKIVHELLQTDEAVRQAIRARFGGGVFDGERLARDALGEIVFADRAALSDLNRIVHPAVIEELAERLERFRARDTSLVVIDAALLLEVALPFKIDVMIALRCGRAERLRRLQAKGAASEKALAVLESQSAMERSLERADVVIDTEKPVAEVFAEVDSVIAKLLGEGPLSA